MMAAYQFVRVHTAIIPVYHCDFGVVAGLALAANVAHDVSHPGLSMLHTH